MEIITTKQRFLMLKDRLIEELSAYSYPKDYGMINDTIHDFVDSIFGEEYRCQLTESEVHIFNSLLTTLDVNATLLDKYEPTFSVDSSSKTSANKESIAGATSGLIAGIILSSLVFKNPTSLIVGLIIGASTFLGHSIQNKFKHNSHLSSKVNENVKESFDIQAIISKIDCLCSKIDDFMDVCRIQLSRQ